jgi:hypothetical protein
MILVSALAVFALAGPALAQDAGSTEPYRTPRAGEAFSATVFGHHVDVHARDRTRTTAFDVGVLWIPTAR